MGEGIGKKSFFQLKEQRLLKTEFLVNKNYKMKSINILPTLKVNVEKNAEKNNAVVTLNISIFDKENLDSCPFYLSLDMEGFFEWDEDNVNIDSLLNLNAPSSLISYARSIVSQLTVFAGYPPLILPLMNFTK